MRTRRLNDEYDRSVTGGRMTEQLYDTERDQVEKAVLVSLLTGGKSKADASARESMAELEQLADTAGLVVLDNIVQVRPSVDPAYFVGKGKAAEIRDRLRELDAQVAVFDQELSGAQVRNLERELDAKIIDRTQLILDIFAQRARTKEGKLQVELAQLSYLLPRLSGHGQQLSRTGGGIGTRGPGETKLETDRRHIRRRIAELKAEIAEVARQRQLLRERRRKTGVFQVSLVGYTNAGKSTLLRQLTGADTLVENRLFATLDPLSRSMKLPDGKEAVVSDTVGFIRRLPHTLVAAFRATLEEVCEADLVLHVVDSASPYRDEQMRVVEQVLEELDAHRKERLVVFNKTDLLSPEQADMLVWEGDYVRVSAYNADDLERLKQAVQSKLETNDMVFRVPAARGDVIALLYRTGRVLEQEADGDELVVRVRMERADYLQRSRLLAPFLQEQQVENSKRKGEAGE